MQILLIFNQKLIINHKFIQKIYKIYKFIQNKINQFQNKLILSSLIQELSGLINQNLVYLKALR